MSKEKIKEKKINKNLPVPANSLEKYLTEISNYEILSREEEAKYAQEYRDSGDLQSARKLITANLKFVVKIAMEYRNYGLNLMDVIQEGNLGLMQAVTKFDPTKRYRLISYGVWWIRAYIQNFIMKNWSLVKIGTTQGQRKLFYKIRSAKSLYNSGNLSLEEYYQKLSTDLKVSIKEIKEILLDPEDGLIVRVNKNTYWRKELDADEFKALIRWKHTITHAMWIGYTTMFGIIIKLIFF